MTHEEEENNAGIWNPDGMGHHSRSKAFAHVSQNAEKHAKDRNHDHHATALVAVGQAKKIPEMMMPITALRESA